MITASIPIEMCCTWLYADENLTQTWLPSEVEIDTADYPGLVNAWFECLIEGDYGSAPEYPYGTVELVDEFGTLYATCVHTDVYLQRVREPITLRQGVTKYYLRFPRTDGSLYYAVYDLRTARIILDVVDSTAAKVQVELITADESAPGGSGDEEANNFWGYAISSTSLTYTPTDDSGDLYYRRVLLTKSNWSTVTEWEFEAMGAAGRVDTYGGGQVDAEGYIALFDATTDTMVPGSELHFTSHDPIRRTAVIADADLVDGHEFIVKLRRLTAPGSQYMMLYKANLNVTLDPVTKMEVHWRMGCVTGGSLGGTGLSDPDYDSNFSTEARYLHEPSKFEPGTPIYFDATAKETGTNAHMFVCDVAQADSRLETHMSPATTYSIVDGTAYTDVDTVALLPGHIGYWFWPQNVNRGWQNGGIITWAPESSGLGIGYLIGDETTNAAAYLGNATLSRTIRAGGFSFSSYLSGTIPITGVRLECIVWGLRRWYADPIGTISGDLKLTGGASHTFTTSTSLKSSNTGGAAGPSTAKTATVTSEASWTIPLLEAATIDLTLSISNAYETFAMVAFIGLYASASTPVASSQLDFSNVTYERQRSGDISADLTDGNRYLLSFYTESGQYCRDHSATYLIFLVERETPVCSNCLGTTATIDTSTMMVTGTGTADYATSWRVIRVKDEVVMASGTGDSASYSFPGEIGVEYQLQFKYEAS